MTRITNHLHKNVLSVIMDIIEMDHFREPELEEVQFFLESTGTHGSPMVHENAVEMKLCLPKFNQGRTYYSDLDNPFPSIN